MKYIRTKDGIYEIEHDLGHIVITKQECPDTELFIKKSDTIEELCDKFVFMSYGNPLIINSLDIPRKYVENYANQTYGAIWTEWGLKYVAKMNDKGEVELL